MIKGTITTKHILLHPVMLIAALGFWRYCKLLVNCVGRKPKGFTDFLF